MIQPLVSVIVPYYKHSQFVERCLNSVAAQTYDNIELIVIDDCSPDASGAFVEKLCKSKDLNRRFSGRVKFEGFERNQGAHAAINYGIQHSEGDVITIVNSDDMYHANRVELAIRAIQEQNIEFVFTQVRYLDKDDKDITDLHELAVLFRNTQQRIQNFATVGFACLASNVAISTGNFVFTKNLYKGVGRFKEYRYCHDWDFLLRALTLAEPAFLKDDLYYYRFHEENSFESLQNIAHQESTSVLTSYFSKVRYNQTSNPIAPTPFNWPGYFELFLKLWDKQNFYQMSKYTAGVMNI